MALRMGCPLTPLVILICRLIEVVFDRPFSPFLIFFALAGVECHRHSCELFGLIVIPFKPH